MLARHKLSLDQAPCLKRHNPGEGSVGPGLYPVQGNSMAARKQIQVYSQLSLRRTPLGPDPTVPLREVSVL